MKTKVVNCRKEAYDIYIGRPSILGNPFKIGPDGSRADVIAKHMDYARKRIKWDVQFRKAVAHCRGRRLGCFCAPLPCHGDNYVILAEELAASANKK